LHFISPKLYIINIVLDYIILIYTNYILCQLFCQNKNDDFEYQDNQTIIEDSKELFKGKDFIMETGAISKVKRLQNIL